MVIWSVPARADLRSIHDFVAHDSPHYAKKVAMDIVARADVLAELPRIGRVVPEMGDETVRELPVHSYRIIYEIEGPKEVADEASEEQ